MGHLILNSNYSRFQAHFEKGFFPDTVRTKYRRLIGRTPDIFQEIEDLVEFSIQSVSLPEISLITVEQSASQGSWARTFKSGMLINIKMLLRGITVSF